MSMAPPPDSVMFAAQGFGGGASSGFPGVSVYRSRIPVAYPQAIAWMEQRVADIRRGTQREALWLLEHPPLYTAGTSARPGDLLDPERFAVYQTGRGGQYTYHGPGQRVVYVMLDLTRRGRDVRAFVAMLERWVIATLAALGVQGYIRTGRVGVWVERGTDAAGHVREAKIAALGIRVRKWVSFHGIAINVNPQLSHFEGIVPCGIREHGVTSLHALGVEADMRTVDQALLNAADWAVSD